MKRAEDKEEMNPEKNEKEGMERSDSAKDSKKYADQSAEGSEGDLVQEPSGAAAYAQNAEEQLRGYRQQQSLPDSLQDPRIPTGGGHTEEEYMSLPDDLRVELIDGVFYAMASPARIHQMTAFEIAKQIDYCIEESGKECYMYIAPSDVALGDDLRTIVQPDVYVHCDKEKDKGTGPLRTSPDFVVEVLSPSNPEHDMWRKRDLYKRHGVREYWIVNPYGKKIYVFTFEKNSGPQEYDFRGVVPIGISDGRCSVDFTRIYEKIRHHFGEE